MEKSQNSQWGLILLIWAAGLGAAAQYGKISVIFARLPEVYPEAGASLGFIVSLVGGLGIVLGVVAGVIVARVGFRRAFLWGLGLGAVLSAAQSLWPPLPVFLGLRLLEGAAHLALVVAGPTLIAQIVSEQGRGLAMTLWGSFFGVAFMILSWLGVPLAEAWGLGALLQGHALFMALMAVILAPRLPKQTGQVAAFKLSELLPAHLRLYRDARVGAAAWGWLLYTICFLSTLTLLPPFLPEAVRAFTIGAMPLMSILSSLTIGVLLLRMMPAASVVILGFLLSAGLAGALCLFQGSPALVLALGATLGLVQGASFAVVPDLNETPEDRALANGGLAQMGNLGNTIGTPLLIWVIAMGGYIGFLGLLVVLFAGGGALHFWLARQRASPSQD